MKFKVVSVNLVEDFVATGNMFTNKSNRAFYEIEMLDEALGKLMFKVDTLQDARKYKIGSTYELKLTEIL
jgi:hypothetical protein